MQPVDVTPPRVGVARTLSGLLPKEPTDTLASAEPPSPCVTRGGRVWPGRLRIVSIFNGLFSCSETQRGAKSAKISACCA